MTKKNHPPTPTDHHHIYDLRLQERFVVKQLWMSEQVAQSINSLDDLQAATQGFEEKQPALGLFSEKDLKQVQKNFPYPIKK